MNGSTKIDSVKQPLVISNGTNINMKKTINLNSKIVEINGHNKGVEVRANTH